jgi:hypothetical protein
VRNPRSADFVDAILRALGTRPRVAPACAGLPPAAFVSDHAGKGRFRIGVAIEEPFPEPGIEELGRSDGKRAFVAELDSPGRGQCLVNCASRTVPGFRRETPPATTPGARGQLQAQAPRTRRRRAASRPRRRPPMGAGSGPPRIELSPRNPPTCLRPRMRYALRSCHLARLVGRVDGDPLARRMISLEDAPTRL